MQGDREETDARREAPQPGVTASRGRENDVAALQ